MAASTVVDQLIVKLGLDPKDFSKGQKEAARGIVETEKAVKRSSEGMSKSILGFTGKLLGVATAAALIKKVLGSVSDLSVTIRQLGIDSKNFNIAASEMRNFQNISEMMGGKSEGVTKSIENITKAVYDLAYNGQISDSLLMLGRLGVQFQDTAGNARGFKDIVLDSERAIQRLMKSGTSRANANQLLLQAGFDPGLAQAMLQGNVGQQLAQQGERRQVNSGDVTMMTDWEKSATSRDQELAATGLGLPTTVAQAKLTTAANKGIEASLRAGKDVESFSGALESGAEKIKKATNAIVDSFEDMGARMLRAVYPKGRNAYEDTIQTAAKRYGLDPEMLAGVLATESNFDPAAKNPKSGATGIAQLMPKYFPDAGKNPHADIEEAAAYLKALQTSFLKDGNDEAASNYLALQAYNAGQSRLRKSMSGKGPPLKPETVNYPGKVMAYAAGAVPTPNAQSGNTSSSTSKTDVSIGNVTVNTQAKDADGIARDFAGATRRKMLAAQADVGMK